MKQLSLETCKDIPIIIQSPINLDANFDSIYIRLNSSGYNLLNLNDSFYSDICSTYTSESGTDICMSGRKTYVFDQNSNITFCQSGCSFISYDYINKKSICECGIRKEEIITDVSKISFNTNEFVDNFYKTIENSNFLVMKCYKLVFSLKSLSNNKGGYFIFSLEFIFIILSIWNCIKGNKTLDKYIFEILKNKINYSHNKNNKKRELEIKVENSTKIGKNKNENANIKKKNIEKEKNIFRTHNSIFKHSLRLISKKKYSINPIDRMPIKRGKSVNIRMNYNFKNLRIHNNRITSLKYKNNKSEHSLKPLFPPKKNRYSSKKQRTRIESMSRNPLLNLNNLSKSLSTKQSSFNLILNKPKTSKSIQ